VVRHAFTSANFLIDSECLKEQGLRTN
jgi:hypothetical protein